MMANAVRNCEQIPSNRDDEKSWSKDSISGHKDLGNHR